MKKKLTSKLFADGLLERERERGGVEGEGERERDRLERGFVMNRCGHLSQLFGRFEFTMQRP